MHIILFILIFLGIIIVFGLSIVGAILKAIFGIGSRPSTRSGSTPNTQQQRRSAYHSSMNNASDKEENIFAENKRPQNKHKKIFSKDEGEYVDFEEVKE